jgi:heme/copper-type cytochrome/quinol oxidase subunit 1
VAVPAYHAYVIVEAGVVAVSDAVNVWPTCLVPDTDSVPFDRVPVTVVTVLFTSRLAYPVFVPVATT